MTRNSPLPRGQRALDHFPRFGLLKFANRFPSDINEISIELGGDIAESILRSADLRDLERVDQISDFHCVTTWTKQDVHWSGFRFADIYRRLALSHSWVEPNIEFVVFRSQDGYRVGMSLHDLLAKNVLLADTLDGQALPIAHGAPVRLVAPAHYGYKNIKHVSRIEFWSKERDYRRAAFKFMDHPRARVEHEERGRIFPGWLLRYLYRPLVGSTIRKFEKAFAEHTVTEPNEG